MTNSIVCFFFFFCQLTSIVESHGISQIDELSLRENIDALPRAILSIVLCTKDENLSSNRRRILNLSLIFLVANVFSNNFQDTSRVFLCVYIYENFQIKCEDLKTRTWIKIFFLFLHMEQPFVDI